MRYHVMLSVVCGVCVSQAQAAAEWSQVRVWINEKNATYVITLKRAGKTIGSNTGKGSQRVKINAVGADTACINFSAGYRIKAPDGRLYQDACNPMEGRFFQWRHNNILKP